MTSAGETPSKLGLGGKEGDALSLNAEENWFLNLSKQGLMSIGGKVTGKTWAHPAYAGTQVYARSDRELVYYELRPKNRFSLAVSKRLHVCRTLAPCFF